MSTFLLSSVFTIFLSWLSTIDQQILESQAFCTHYFPWIRTYHEVYPKWIVYFYSIKNNFCGLFLNIFVDFQFNWDITPKNGPEHLLITLLSKKIFLPFMNISWNGCKILVFWPQLPIDWHQVLPIWLILWPRPPNSYLLRGSRFFVHYVNDFQKSLCYPASNWLRDQMNKLYNQSKAPSYLLHEYTAECMRQTSNQSGPRHVGIALAGSGVTGHRCGLMARVHLYDRLAVAPKASQAVHANLATTSHTWNTPTGVLTNFHEVFLEQNVLCQIIIVNSDFLKLN